MPLINHNTRVAQRKMKNNTRYEEERTKLGLYNENVKKRYEARQEAAKIAEEERKKLEEEATIEKMLIPKPNTKEQRLQNLRELQKVVNNDKPFTEYNSKLLKIQNNDDEELRNMKMNLLQRKKTRKVPNRPLTIRNNKTKENTSAFGQALRSTNRGTRVKKLLEGKPMTQTIGNNKHRRTFTLPTKPTLRVSS